MLQNKHAINRLPLVIVLFCMACVYSKEVSVGSYKLTYAEPNDFMVVEHNQPDVLDVWKNANSGDVIMIQAFRLPNGLDIVESGVIEGIQETIGAKIGNFRDFQSTHLLFREGTAEIPNLGAMVYLSYWWADGICLKVQGMYTESNATVSIQAFRKFLSEINVSTDKQAIVERSKQSIDLDSHKISKMLAQARFMILIVLAIYVISKKRKNKQGSD